MVFVFCSKMIVGVVVVVIIVLMVIVGCVSSDLEFVSFLLKLGVSFV